MKLRRRIGDGGVTLGIRGSPARAATLGLTRITMSSPRHPASSANASAGLDPSYAAGVEVPSAQPFLCERMIGKPV